MLPVTSHLHPKPSRPQYLFYKPILAFANFTSLADLRFCDEQSTSAAPLMHPNAHRSEHAFAQLCLHMRTTKARRNSDSAPQLCFCACADALQESLMQPRTCVNGLESIWNTHEPPSNQTNKSKYLTQTYSKASTIKNNDKIKNQRSKSLSKLLNIPTSPNASEYHLDIPEHDQTLHTSPNQPN